ncbi:FAD:protein FMN transferase [Duganella sp. BJB488]|uniref:FAD:protein FMN transferase n=1 Tax=unclassified Duganella TaxID=2636909 RepID=UPI000E353E1C|nr:MULTISPECIES: FAD:protein FMN transferase [unclassified Duganella]RFP11705.1 FAD:protein FMN transferase [Duganella sp. BJB489]RFP15582.1 FAD:protein FMN transferase [Duganella sp. BJB488]RFP30529.1 FAD:protein FMN transferase [Duganella sp. BJB480]
MRRVLLPHVVSEDAPPAGGVIRDFAGHSMGTSWSVRLVAAPDDPCAHVEQGLQQQLDAVVAEMSHWEIDSDLGRFNRAEAGSWQQLPPAFFDVLSFALDVARESGRAYDPCAGALVNLWGFGPHGRFGQPDFVPPSPAQISAALALPPALLDREGRRAWQPGGVQLDLSAVAKGYSVDRLVYHLKSQGYAHCLVEVGGELRGAGVKPDGQPWWVALEQVGDAVAQQPDQLVLALHGLSVATSGDYRRYFELDGRRYSHTIDPRNGMPIANDLASVTVVHPQCVAADAWSTALTVLGCEHGLRLAERQGLAARFVARQADGGFTEHMSTHLHSMLDE